MERGSARPIGTGSNLRWIGLASWMPVLAYRFDERRMSRLGFIDFSQQHA